MENLSENNCIMIGKFQKLHGISGTLQLNFEPEWESSVVNAGVLLTKTDGLLLPWFVARDRIRITSSGTALVDLDWVDDEITAKKLCGNIVYLEKNKILLQQNVIGFSKWKGFKIFDESGNCIGEITGEENYSGNIVVSVKTDNGEKIIPFHDDLILSVNRKLKKMTMILPDGLLNI